MYRPPIDDRLLAVAIACQEYGMDPLCSVSSATLADAFSLLLLGAAVPCAWIRGSRPRAIYLALLGAAFAALGPSLPRPMGPFVRAFHVAFAVAALAFAAWPASRQRDAAVATSPAA